MPAAPPPPAAYPPAPAGEANPYGGWTTAPAGGYGAPGQPGSLAYVEAHIGPVASFGDRALALLIDVAFSLLFVVPMVVGVVLVVAGVPKDTFYDAAGERQVTGGNGALLAVGIVVLVLSWLASVLFQLWNRVWRMGRTGQSLGKSRMGLRLVDDRTGRPIGAGMCFVREFVSGLVNSVVYLSYLWMLWDENRQTVADKAAHSTVVKLPGA